MSHETKDSALPPSYSEAAGIPPPQNQAYPMHGAPQQYTTPQYGYNQYPGQQPGYPQAYPGTNVVVTQPGVGVITTQAPPDQMGAAIFVTLCCFWPTGIFAIMRASEAKNAAARGDMMTAQTNAQSARQFINISIGLGIASIIVLGVIIGVYVGVIANNWYDY